METLTAVHIREGRWKFVCPLHTQQAVWRSPATENYAFALLRAHVDEHHPGVKVRFFVKDRHTIHTTYTGTTTIDAGDLL